jgi:hypothetical protein
VCESRGPVSRPDASGPALLRLARSSREAGREKLRTLTPEQQAQACQEIHPGMRGEFLMLVEMPEEIVPLLEPAELVSTIRASGMSDGAWLLEMATPEQRVACIDLDCWGGYELATGRVLEWIDALIEAGRPTLINAIGEFDPEVWVLAMKRMTEVAVVAKEDDPPDGWFTEDGVVYFGPSSDEDFARVKEIAQATFSEAQSRYYQLVYGVLFELSSDTEEFALKWHEARMGDLGFPTREHAMEAYKPLAVEEAPVLEVTSDEDEMSAVVPGESLPRQLQGSLLGEALRTLPAGRAVEVLGYVLAVANTLAVADGLLLSDVDSIPEALAKAVKGIDLGLRELSRARDQAPGEVLDRSRPLDLFRIGATLDDSLRRT